MMQNFKLSFPVIHTAVFGIVAIAFFLVLPSFAEAKVPVSGCYYMGDGSLNATSFTDTNAITSVDADVVTFIATNTNVNLKKPSTNANRQVWLSDVDGDDVVGHSGSSPSSTDREHIQWYINGTITTFPVCQLAYKKSLQPCIPDGNAYNADSKIGREDASVVLEYSAGISRATTYLNANATRIGNADVRNHQLVHSGVNVKADDATLILQYQLGLITDFSLANGNRGCYKCSGSSCVSKADILDDPVGYTSDTCNSACVAALTPTPTATNTPAPTATRTPTPVPPTATRTPTPVPPTATRTPTPTPGGGTATPTPTPTPGGGTATPTPTPTPGGGTATPTPTSAPTSTPIPSTFTISGNVYVDTNENGVQDCSGACDNGPGDESNYPGATVSRIPDGSTTTTNASGDYSFVSLPADSYTITLAVPLNYNVTTTNPVSNVVVGPSKTVNFGIISAAPSCTIYTSTDVPKIIPDSVSNLTDSLLVVPGSFNITDVDVVNINITHNQDEEVNARLLSPSGTSTLLFRNVGGDGDNFISTNLDQSAATSITSGTAPFTGTYRPEGRLDDFNGQDLGGTWKFRVMDTNDSDSAGGVLTGWGLKICPAAPTPTSTPLILSGAVVIDSAGNNCDSGTNPYTTGATITTFSGVSQTGTDDADGSGAYLINDLGGAGERTAVLSNIVGYQLKKVKYQGGLWVDPTSVNAYTFDFSANRTLDFCVNNITPWFQTTTGDARMSTFTNKVPAGETASSDPFNPSVFYSSSFTSNFGAGSASQKGWNVDDEYSYQADSENVNGTASYSFYASRVAQTNVATNTIPGCSSGSCSVDINSLATGVYRHEGDLTITSYSHSPGAHVLILVDGNITIASNIQVPPLQNNLLIVAAKGNITIDKAVGTTASDTNPIISGIFTAEGNIIADGDGCPAAIPDKRLNIQGSIIANSRKPFSVDGGGTFVNSRSLCLNNQNYPSIYVDSRLDFIMQLTSFYKTKYIRWRELAP